MKIVAIFFYLSSSKEKSLSYHSGRIMLRINQNSIFSEFLKIVKNTWTRVVINNIHNLFVVVPKIATQSDSLALKRDMGRLVLR